ncbi:phage tail tape measure protein [Sulfitobacter sp.]|uniref:phage tail tape measure protein n=1 Tax=Sulfitobacter sp. TaxID=1903071 RepID=UPI0030035A22
MSDLPGLIVDIEARMDKLERGFKKANAVQNRASGQMEARAQRSANKLRDTYGKAGDGILATFKRLGPGLAGGLIGGLTVGALSGLSQNLGRIVNETAQIGDEAKRAGVSVRALQEWKFVGEQNRIGIDQVVDGLKELNLRADEFIITKSGPAAEAFARLGISATELETKLKDPSELLLEIIGRMEDMDQAARIRISDELFGGSAGERFAELVSRGENELRKTIRAANETGAVLDSELIEKAAELDRRYAALQSRMDSFWKSFVIGAVDAGIKIATLRTDLDDLFRSYQQADGLLGKGAADALRTDSDAAAENADQIAALRRQYEALGDVADNTGSSLMQAAATLRQLGYDDIADALVNASEEMRTLTGEMQDGTISADEFEQRMQIAADTANTALGEIEAIDRVNFGGVIAQVGGLITRLAQAAAKARELRASLPGASPDGETTPLENTDSGPRSRNGHRAATPGLAVTTSPRPNLPSIDALFGSPEPSSGGGGNGRGAGGGAQRRNDLEREIEAITQETNALRLEAQALAELTGAQMAHGDALEFARTKADLLAAAQRAGVANTPELRAQVDKLAGEYVKAGNAAELAADKIEEVQNASKAGADRVANVFEGLASGALTAKEAVGQLILEVIKLSLKKRLLDAFGGAGGGILKILGGGFASGGYTGNGGTFEPAGVVHKGEYVLSKAATAALGVGNLDALHASALRGYSGGGLVGAARTASALPMSRASAAAPSIEISAPVTVHGSAGTPDQNNDLARKMARELESTVRGAVATELQRQMRPGNLLNRRA